VWGISVGLMGPFTSVYMLQELKISFLMVTMVSVLPSAIIAITQVYYGRLADHFGSLPVLRISTYIILASTLLWLTTGPERTWPLFLLQAVSGAGWSAYNISMNNMVLKLAPPASRSSYIAALGAVYAVSQAIAPVVGGIILSGLRGVGVPSLNTYYILFGIAALLRLVATPMLGSVHEEGGRGVGHLIRVMGRFRSMGAAPGTDILFDYTYTHLARIADFVTRRHGVQRRAVRRGH
jgi:MFS family permease